VGENFDFQVDLYSTAEKKPQQAPKLVAQQLSLDEGDGLILRHLGICVYQMADDDNFSVLASTGLMSRRSVVGNFEAPQQDTQKQQQQQPPQVQQKRQKSLHAAEANILYVRWRWLLALTSF
jgi:hypothetical protein